MVYHVRALHNYFIPCHEKYNGQHSECDIRVAPLEGLGEKRRIYNGFPVFGLTVFSLVWYEYLYNTSKGVSCT